MVASIVNQDNTLEGDLTSEDIATEENLHNLQK